MNYDELLPTYRAVQLKRVLDSTRQIRRRATALGKVVPELDDLPFGDGRRLNLAVLFLDICGFSSRSSENQQEQEKILITLHLFFTEMVRIAENYGGVVEKNTGDGFMAYFEDGGGSPAEASCKRALSSALTMMSTAKSVINPLLQVMEIEPVHFRVGIEYGAVTIARLGAAKRFNSIVAIGTAANIAAKMLALAGAGEILIGDRVLQQVPPEWYRFVEPLEKNSGWLFRESGEDYPFYRFFGRWREPA